MYKNNDVPNRLMTMKEFIEVSGVGKTMAYKLVNQEDFPKLRINSRIYVPVLEYNNWVKSYLRKEYEV